MKKIVLLMVSLIVSLNSVAVTEKNNPYLKIAGEFIAEKRVNYEVFIVHGDSLIESAGSGSCSRLFNMDFRTGYEYLIRFTSKKNEVKYLYVNAAQRGVFLVNIDFSLPESALLNYNSHKGRYDIVKIQTERMNKWIKKDFM